MKIRHLLFVVLSIFLIACSGSTKKQDNTQATPSKENQGIEKAEKAGWRLGIQSFTFHKFSVVEALDKTQELGVKFIEIYPGHKLGGKWGEKPFDFNLTATERQEIKDLAASKGIKIVATGVYQGDSNEDWEKMFSFAKDMGMEFITCEPAVKYWDLMENLSQKYGIKVSVHNHPQPSDYWNPDLLLAQISERSKSLGSGCDIGHWRREGLDELECIKKLDGRVISLHFKDIIAKPSEGEQHDAIWGQGVLNIDGVLKELKRQNFQGVFSIEYEYNWDNSVPDIKECIKYYNEITDQIF